MLADGTQVDARAVLSNADPKRTFLRLVYSEDLPAEFVRAISRIRFESSSFKLNLALRELPDFRAVRSEEHTSELQSRLHLVCRLLLEKKKIYNRSSYNQQAT